MTTAGPSGPPVASEAFAAVHAWARSEPLYVILGSQGSGTNLLVRLLSCVFGMTVLRDQSLVFRTSAGLAAHPTRDEVTRHFARLTSHMFPSAIDRRLRRRLLHREERFDGIKACFDGADIRCGRDLLMFVHAFRAFRDDARLMGVKSDDVWAHLADVARLCPDRRVIFLTRDPRDTVVSVMSKSFGPVEPLIAARYVRRRLLAYAQAFAEAPSPKVHLRFEDLVETPAAAMREAAAAFSWTVPEDLDGRLASVPIREHRVGRWTRLSARDLAWCEGVLGDCVALYGSPLASRRPGAPGLVQSALAHGRDAIGRVPAKVAFLRALAGGRT